MINTCDDCNAIREYPDGKKITKCPRCGSIKIRYSPSPTTQKERDELLLKAIRGDDVQ